MKVGARIIDVVIKSVLCKAQCAESAEHSCVVVWSSGAEEQLEAVVGQVALENDRMKTALKFISGCENLREAREAALQAGICAEGSE